VSGTDRKDLSVHIAILTFEGFNELDSLIALGVLNRIKPTTGTSPSRPPPRR
jgi:hypothetical protein